MDHDPPAGPHGGNLRIEHALIPEGAVGQTGLFAAFGPGYDTGRGWKHQSPGFTLRTSTSTCRLTVEEDGRVLAQHWDRDGVHSQKRYDRVSGFIITSKNTSRIGPEREFGIKIVYSAGIYERSQKTDNIWESQSLCVQPSMKAVRAAFLEWVHERGLGAIDDQY